MTTKTLFAVCVKLDQTFGFLMDEDGNSPTTRHPEAHLYATREDAEARKTRYDASLPTHYPVGHPNAGEAIPDVERSRYTAWVTEVGDETEFRAREDTW